MDNFILNNLFRITFSTLNFVSPSILADILLHPFDFATVLLQIGYDPEGIKYETATLVSVIVQYAFFTFYIPYLLTSMQGLQFLGMPHPSIFYYVNYIYSKEGFAGCYRGLMPKICERLIMISVNDKVKRSINKDTVRNSNRIETQLDQENFLRNLINGVCSQFFAVLASHPFHVLMVSSFAEFTYNKKSSILELSHSIYKGDGYFGFFTGLVRQLFRNIKAMGCGSGIYLLRLFTQTARLLGELLSLIFSVTYTTIINTQMRPQYPVAENSELSSQRTAHFVNYVTDVSRFTAFKQPKSVENEETDGTTVNEESEPNILVSQHRNCQYFRAFCNFLENMTQYSTTQRYQLRENHARRRNLPLLAYLPLTSKLFYYIMIRDFLSKKISNPFLLVCHCAIALDSGWDKFPLLTYLGPVVDFTYVYLIPSRSRSPRRKKIIYFSKDFNVRICCFFGKP